MFEAGTAERLKILRIFALAGGLGTLALHIALLVGAPQDSALSHLRVPLALLLSAFFVATYYVRLVQRYVEPCIKALVLLIVGAFLYDCYRTGFSFLTTLALSSAVMASSMVFLTVTGLVSFYLATLAALGVLLLFVETSHNVPAVVMLAFVTTGSIMCIALGSSLRAQRRQDAYHQELLKARAMADEALQIRSSFLAKMSHEIRTPMNGVIGMASVLQDTELSCEQQRMVSVINSSGENLMHLVNDILDFSKIDHGRLELEHIAFNPHTLTTELVELLGPRAVDKGVTLVCEMGAGVPQELVGDEHRLRQVLTNLISNAIKFTDRGEVRVWLDGQMLTDGQYRLEGKVIDTGVGIAQDKLGSLFDAFAQADLATTRVYGGTGLGLSISKELIDLMHGQIHVQSTLGEGSTFSFFVLLGPSTSASGITEAPAMEACETLADAAAAVGAAPRVLLAEDNPVNQQVANKMLERLGLSADLAATGNEAVRAAIKQPYDLILMDIQMPELDGVDAVRCIRQLQHGKGAFIVALTANAMAGDAEHYIGAGMNTYLPKPVTLQSLQGALEAFARHRAS